MLTTEDKKQILKSFLETIEGISNKEYQERVWIRGEGPEVDDFDETVCHFFQEADGILDESNEFELYEVQLQILKKFRDQFKNFSDENDFPEEFMDSSEWNLIIKAAQDTLKVFKSPKNQLL